MAQMNLDDVDEDDGVLDGLGSVPTLLHRFHPKCSILTIVVKGDLMYAGTQDGDVLVYNLNTLQKQTTFKAHNNSLLSLHLPMDTDLLFSSSVDRFVNVWRTSDFTQVASIYPHPLQEHGDIYCVAYSKKKDLVIFGTQNTSIQWAYLEQSRNLPPPDPDNHPSVRQDAFFDSIGPDGLRTPRQGSSDAGSMMAAAEPGFYIEVDPRHVVMFAHHGFVFSMLLTDGARAGFEDEEVLFTSGGEGWVKIWRLPNEENPTPQALVTLDHGHDAIQCVYSIAVDGNFLFTGQRHGDISIWDLETRQKVRGVKNNKEEVWAVCTGQGMLFTGANDGLITQWDSRYERVRSWKAHERRILASVFVERSSRAIMITGAGDETISIWDFPGQSVPLERTVSTAPEEVLETLKRFIAFPSVSYEQAHKADCRRAASYLRATLKRLGATADLIGTDKGFNPILYGRFKASDANASKNNILFYGHYDVIDAQRKQSTWESDPFKMEGKDGYIWGRGTSDNKGPVIAAIYAAADLAVKKKLSSDVVFLIEGEEECGSRGFAAAIERNKDLIGPIDWILLANSYWLDDDVPCLTYGLRGVIHAIIEVYNDNQDLHSGVDGSGLMAEPVKDLIALTAKLTADDGKITLPKFYDSIPPVTEHELKLYDEIAKTLLEKDPGLGSPEDITKSLMARWREPTLTVHRIRTSGPTNSTVISHCCQADVSMRLVPNQDVDAIASNFTKFLETRFAEMRSYNKLDVKIYQKAEPWLGDYNNRLFKILEQAVSEAWTNGERKPLYIREGGSIAAIRCLEKTFGAPAAHLPCGQASDSAHLDNERFRVQNLYKAKEVFEAVFEKL